MLCKRCHRHAGATQNTRKHTQNDFCAHWSQRYAFAAAAAADVVVDQDRQAETSLSLCIFGLCVYDICQPCNNHFRSGFHNITQARAIFWCLLRVCMVCVSPCAAQICDLCTYALLSLLMFAFLFVCSTGGVNTHTQQNTLARIVRTIYLTTHRLGLKSWSPSLFRYPLKTNDNHTKPSPVCVCACVCAFCLHPYRIYCLHRAFARLFCDSDSGRSSTNSPLMRVIAEAHMHTTRCRSSVRRTIGILFFCVLVFGTLECYAKNVRVQATMPFNCVVNRVHGEPVRRFHHYSARLGGWHAFRITYIYRVSRASVDICVLCVCVYVHLLLWLV